MSGLLRRAGGSGGASVVSRLRLCRWADSGKYWANYPESDKRWKWRKADIGKSWNARLIDKRVNKSGWRWTSRVNEASGASRLTPENLGTHC